MSAPLTSCRLRSNAGHFTIVPLDPNLIPSPDSVARAIALAYQQSGFLSVTQDRKDVRGKLTKFSVTITPDKYVTVDGVRYTITPATAPTFMSMYISVRSITPTYNYQIEVACNFLSEHDNLGVKNLELRVILAALGEAVIAANTATTLHRQAVYRSQAAVQLRTTAENDYTSDSSVHNLDALGDAAWELEMARDAVAQAHDHKCRAQQRVDTLRTAYIGARHTPTLTKGDIS